MLLSFSVSSSQSALDLLVNLLHLLELTLKNFELGFYIFLVICEKSLTFS